MSKIFVIHKNQILFFIAIVVIFFVTMHFTKADQALPVNVGGQSERVIHMVTGEFKATTADGKEIESYRWDPGTIFVNVGENVKLSIFGINGMNHPFVIEDLNIKGEVRKGEETIVNFTAEKEGIYRIICLTHPDTHNNGPMIGYIVVQ